MKRNCPICPESNHPKTRVFKQSEYSVCMLSNPRLVKGHVLVVPKRHVEYPGELKNEELVDIFRHIEQIRRKQLKLGLGTGVDVRQHHRPFLPQSRLKLDHVHFHVLPRTLKDDIYHKTGHHETGLFDEPSPEEIKEISELLSDDT